MTAAQTDQYDDISLGHRLASGGLSTLFTAIAATGAYISTAVVPLLSQADTVSQVAGGGMAACGVATAGLALYAAYKLGREAITGKNSVPRGAESFGRVHTPVLDI